MYRIEICRSTGSLEAVVLAETLATLYEEEIPDDLDEIVEDYGGDFYNIEEEEEEEKDDEFGKS